MDRYLFYIAQNYSYQILRPLQEKIWARGDEVRWLFDGDEVNRNYLRDSEISISSVAEVKKFKPLAVFAPGNIIPSFIPGLKVALFHGFNIGKMNRRGGEDHFQIRGCFDLYCTQGPNTTGRFQELAEQHGYFRVIETGWPGADPIFDNQNEVSRNAKPTILMCSTFSRNLSCAPHLYEQVKALSARDNWRWLVQFHPKMSRDIVSRYKGLQNENLTFVETDNVIPLLQQADVMVCDTSSVMTMFQLLRKPVVTFGNLSPGPHLHNIDEPDALEDALRYALQRPEPLMQEIAKFIGQTHPYADGDSSSRVLRAVDDVLQAEPLTAKKPLNLVRNLKARKRLNYWNFF